VFSSERAKNFFGGGGGGGPPPPGKHPGKGPFSLHPRAV